MVIFLKAIFLGLVEGITEFLPISSTGHLIIMNQFINFTGEFAYLFDIVIQLGAIFSVIVYFWKRLCPMGRSKTNEEKKAILNLWQKTVAGVLPALLIGGLAGKAIEEFLFNPLVVALALIAGGLALIFIENREKSASITNVSGIGYRTAVAIGFIQCLAMIPGTSRSAATIMGAMLLGASRETAAEFSFFLAVPTMMAASAYSLLKTGLSFTILEWQVLAVGFMVSFLVAWAVIALFMNYIRKHDFKGFAYYRIVLGLIVFLYFQTSFFSLFKF